MQHADRRSRTKRWLMRYPRGMPLGIFVAIAGITLLSIIAIELGERQSETAQIDARADAIASALERRANAGSAYLRAGAALLSTMAEVPAADFRRFVSELRLDADYRGAEGLGWAQVVRPSEVEAFNVLLAGESAGTAELYPQLGQNRRFAVPVTYLQPETQRNRRTLGFDMYSEPVRRAAMVAAINNERPSASDAIMLEDDLLPDEPGFLIFMPVFEAGNGAGNGLANEVGSGGRSLKGFIFSPFNGRDFLQSALELEDAGSFGVRLYDSEAADRALIASNADADPAPGDSTTRTLTIADNRWLLSVSSPGNRGLSGLSIATLIFGLLLASLLLLVVRMLTLQAQEDEATLARFAEQASIRNSLTRELNHRVKNTLANVLSIIALTRRRTSSVADFADGLEGRIRALSATHDLLTQSDWGATPVRAVIDAELLPYAHDADQAVEMQGGDVDLAPNDALSLGLAVHELATNAAKYGALSQPGGRVQVHWQTVSPEMVRVEWRESGGPPVPQERRRGFGTDLIERIVAHELRHPVELDFAPEGVRCVLLIPVRRPGEFMMRAQPEANGNE